MISQTSETPPEKRRLERWRNQNEDLLERKTRLNLLILAASVIAGVIIGALSALVGIGGGTLTTPFLIWRDTAIRNAIATSAACGVPISVAGMSGYIAAGWHETGLPAGATGFVYWPAFAAIVATSVLAAPVGARLTHALPVRLLRRLFAGLLVVAAWRLASA